VVGTLKPISSTAFYCCGVRMEDAARGTPVCGDRYAQRFMDEEALGIFAPFRRFTYPNASNVARHRVIDDLLRERLARDKSVSVVLIGCGFDTRAYRLDGGHWFELDEPAVLDCKGERLPVTECPNPLWRIPVDFETDSLEGKLAALPARGSILVVVEGVLMYLRAAQRRALLQTLRRVWVAHTVLCDTVTRTFFERYSRPIHRHIEALGAHFAPDLDDDPGAIFREHGYRCVATTSIVGRAAQLGAVRMPRLLLRTLLRSLRDGYTVCVFEADQAGGAAGSFALPGG
jgi:methyltransferase (TIGR00027 family)